MASDPNHAFQLQSTSVSYGKTKALNEIDITIGMGERVALVGPSGSGKTTLLYLLNGMVGVDEGEVEALGLEVNKRAEGGKNGLQKLRSKIATIPQDRGLVPNLLVLQNVLLGRVGKKSFLKICKDMIWNSEEQETEVLELLNRVGISEKLYEKVESLSGGQKQRVALARALYQKPLAILADEPVSSLDPARARSVIEILVNVSQEDKLTLVASLHQIDLATEFFPRVIGLRNGSVVFDGAPTDMSESVKKELYELSGGELSE